MTPSSIERRLRKLEFQTARLPSEEFKYMLRYERFIINTIAFYLGDPKPGESIAEVYMRVLGYQDFFEFRRCYEVNDPDYSERMHLAIAKLYEKFGLDVGVGPDIDLDQLEEAFKRMEAGLTGQYKACRPAVVFKFFGVYYAGGFCWLTDPRSTSPA